MMHSQAVMDKGETSVCTSSKQRRVGAVSHLQIKEKRCAHTRKYIIIMHSHTVMDKGETSVCTSSKQRRVDGVRLLFE